jgi:NAD dependent epimerase/dehydratase family enzyme
MLPLFRLGMGGPLGTGRQYWSSITMRDHLRGMRFLLDHPVSGAFNFTAPTPVTNAEFTRALGRALHRPTLIPVPALALRLAVGEFASEILASQRIVPTRLLEAGFRFQDATLEAITSSLL